MSETDLILAGTPEVIKFIISKLGIEQINRIFEKAIKKPVLCSLTDNTLNEGVAIEETARKIARRLIKQNFKEH